MIDLTVNVNIAYATSTLFPTSSYQWSGNLILGFHISTPIIPQRLLVKPLTNISCKRFERSIRLFGREEKSLNESALGHSCKKR